MVNEIFVSMLYSILKLILRSFPYFDNDLVLFLGHILDHSDLYLSPSPNRPQDQGDVAGVEEQIAKQNLTKQYRQACQTSTDSR